MFVYRRKKAALKWNYVSQHHPDSLALPHFPPHPLTSSWKTETFRTEKFVIRMIHSFPCTELMKATKKKMREEKYRSIICWYKNWSWLIMGLFQPSDSMWAFSIFILLSSFIIRLFHVQKNRKIFNDVVKNYV